MSNPAPLDSAHSLTALCERVIVINQGRLVFDGRLAELARRYAGDKLLQFELERPVGRAELAALGELAAWEPQKATLRVPRAEVPDRAARLLAAFPVRDLAIQEPDVEDVIRALFGGEETPHPRSAQRSAPLPRWERGPRGEGWPSTSRSCEPRCRTRSSTARRQ